MSRNYNLIDKLLCEVDGFCQTVFGNVHAARNNPADITEDKILNATEKKQSAGFMRVNHTGEVCAQALYRGQAAFARDKKIKATLQKCCDEETDHLAWCYDRLRELDSHRSYVNVFWYWNSFFIGIIAGIAGDKWSLGFVEETEKQVEAHLNSHLDRLSKNDLRSRKIIAQMKADEIKHGQTAHYAGAAELPFIIKKLMTLQSKVMISLAFWV